MRVAMYCSIWCQALSPNAWHDRTKSVLNSLLKTVLKAEIISCRVTKIVRILRIVTEFWFLPCGSAPALPPASNNPELHAFIHLLQP
jgi:hypothetical protein